MAVKLGGEKVGVSNKLGRYDWVDYLLHNKCDPRSRGLQGSQESKAIDASLACVYGNSGGCTGRLAFG